MSLEVTNTTDNGADTNAQNGANGAQNNTSSVVFDFGPDDLVLGEVSQDSNNAEEQNNSAEDTGNAGQQSNDDDDDYVANVPGDDIKDDAAADAKKGEDAAAATEVKDTNNGDTEDYKSDVEAKEQLTTEVISTVAKKFGIESDLKTAEELFEAIMDKKAVNAFDNNPEAQQIASVLDMAAEEKVRYVLSNNRELYGILSDSDIDKKILAYEQNDELETVAANIDANLQAKLDNIFNTTKQQTVDTQKKIEEDAKTQIEAENKLKSSFDSFNPSSLAGISDKNIKALKADLKEYMFSGKYAEDTFVGVETALKDPTKLLENAMWVNPKIRNYLLAKIEKKAIETGESQFIKKNLSGKAANVGATSVATAKDSTYVTDLKEGDTIQV